MPQYEFVTKEQVRSACKDIGITDWSEKTDGVVDEREAGIIQQIVGGEACNIPLADFCFALEIELEHGTSFPDANVSGNHPIVTGRIVLAHLKESLDYYQRLKCMELEMEFTTALAQGDLQRATRKRIDLAAARQVLERQIAELLSKAT